MSELPVSVGWYVKKYGYKTDTCLFRVMDEYAAHVTAEKDKEIERLRDLVTCLIENDPDDVISDGGHTVLEHWRHDARRAINYVNPFAALEGEKGEG